jgi:hypothetical protein
VVVAVHFAPPFGFTMDGDFGRIKIALVMTATKRDCVNVWRFDVAEPVMNYMMGLCRTVLVFPEPLTHHTRLGVQPFEVLFILLLGLVLQSQRRSVR